jgi:hypothetical protein
VDAVPHFGGALMHEIDGRHVHIFDMPVEECPPRSDEDKRAVQAWHFLFDGLGEKGFEFTELPRSGSAVHEGDGDVDAIDFLFYFWDDFPKLVLCKFTYLSMASGRSSLAIYLAFILAIFWYY